MRCRNGTEKKRSREITKRLWREEKQRRKEERQLIRAAEETQQCN